MTNRKIEMYEYQVIIYCLRQGQSVRSISESKQMGRNTIKKIRLVAIDHDWLNLANPMPSEEAIQKAFAQRKKTPKQTPQASDHHEQISKWIKAGVNGKAIHQYLQSEFSYPGSYERLQKYIAKIKVKLSPELTIPLSFSPGEAAQVDFGKGPDLLDERTGKIHTTCFFVMTLCWSRHQYAEIILHQDVHTWLLCHQRAFEWFGGVPHKIIIDNAKCAITKACYHSPEVQRSYEVFAQEYGFIISACPPREPQKKGRVESGVKYIKGNFFAIRKINSVQNGNQQLKEWVLGPAGNRIHGTTYKQPLTQFIEVEQKALKTLPTILPEIAVWKKVKLYHDCHVRYEKCLYSAPHKYYGEDLWLKATPTLIFIYHEHNCIAQHARRFNPGGEPSTKSEHLPPKSRFYLARDANWCLETSQQVGKNCRLIVESLLTDPVLDLLRQAQSLLRLESTYGSIRLENSCKRAVCFNSLNYKAVKHSLKSGLDSKQTDDQQAFDKLNSVYQGGAKYQRKITTIQ